MQTSSNSLSATSATNAYILENAVYHARYLPASSKHSFAYPTLALLLRLSALESHSLDLFSGRLFGYTEAGSCFPWARVMGIRPEAYLHDPDSYPDAKRRGIREKLESVLRRFDVDPTELHDAWVLTMPRYLGVEGINPLTVYYCYRRTSSGEVELWVVVLEVHNTFGQRHVYVLRSGLEYEDEETLPGFTHSWTFSRQFHVSPFNDRSGYYTCSIVAPSFPPQASELSSNLEARQEPPVLPKILIQLWTPKKQLKLTASLQTISAETLRSRNVLAALVKYPFTLLLSFPRIVWQAFHLHYPLRLDVYARPEPRGVDSVLEESFDGIGIAGTEGVKVVRNDVQRLNGELGVGGSIGWQPEGLLERYARRRVGHFLELRARETGITVRLVSTVPAFESKVYPPSLRNDCCSVPDTEERELTILTRSSRAFLLILASPSPEHALLLARDAERLLAVSNEKLFFELFSLPSSFVARQGHRTMVLQHMLQRLRQLPMPRYLLAPEMKVADAHPLDFPFPRSRSSSPTSVTESISPPHDLAFSLPTFFVLSAFLALTYLEKSIFSLLGARFVKGTEPWGLWERAERAKVTRNSGVVTGGRSDHSSA